MAMDVNEGFDLRSVGTSATPEPQKPLDKEVTKEFKFGNKSWSLRISALDPVRRQKQMRATVQLAENVPVDKLHSEDAFRVRCLASVVSQIDEIPKDLQNAIQTWDSVLAELFFLVEDHSDKYFRAMFGEGETEKGLADGD